MCEQQLRDVRPEDVIAQGHFRLCNTYRGGGGYDQFPLIYERRTGQSGHNLQFVVQLYGCPLDCPYCYVTKDGVWGVPVNYTRYQMASLFCHFGASVFHLMGGAPALQMDRWPELIAELERQARLKRKGPWVFHSDMLLTESWYDPEVLAQIKRPNALYAVSVKGVSPLCYHRNTGRVFQDAKFWGNLASLEQFAVPYYLTFTNCANDEVELFWTRFKREFPDSYELQKRDAFSISLIQYEALKNNG